MGKGDYKKTEEHKKKISETLKGRKQSKNIIEVRVKKLIGKKRTKQQKENIRQGRIGKHHPQKSHKGMFQKGHKPWNYIDGRSKLISPARYGDDWEKIRYLIYVRDKFTCQKCGKTGERLDVHHKIPFLESFDNSLSNLITLCRSCHMKEERKLNNRRQK